MQPQNQLVKNLVLSACVIPLFALSANAQTVAYDNADLYPNNPDHNWPANNGGYGYGNWTGLSDTGGGGTYMDGVGVNGRQVDGNYSFALYSGSGTEDISRPLTSSLTSGEFDITTRFDIQGIGPNLVNLRSGNNTSSFGSGELLSFGIVNDNQLSYTDSSGLHTLLSGEARGSVFSWVIDFNAAAGTYTASVSQVGGGYSGTFGGSLEQSHTSAGSFAVINSSTGNGQNVIFDSPTFNAVPEPATMSLMGFGAAALLGAFRRKE